MVEGLGCGVEVDVEGGAAVVVQVRDEGAAEGGLWMRIRRGFQGTDGGWGMGTHLAGARRAHDQHTEFRHCEEEEWCWWGVNLLKSPLHGLGQVGEAEEEGYLPMRS